ncbi:MAG: hypothetical protein Q8K37_07180, partial [Alphaproteobacteria bacterium]|nr:hypothetical protein [Alphaproteobacteria bacterium]
MDYNSKKIIKITNEYTVNNGNDLKSLYEFLVNDDSDKTKNTDPEELQLDHTISVINSPKDKIKNNNPLTNAQQKLLEHTDQIFPKDSANINWEQLAKHLKQLWDPSNKKTFSGLSGALVSISKNNNINQNTQNYLLDLSKEAYFIYKNEEVKNKPLTDAQQKLLQYTEQIFPKDSANINWEELTRQLKQVWDPFNKKTFSGLRSALLLLSNNNTINQ